VVYGGSWADRPFRATIVFRLSYPKWQKVYNVGFRVICTAKWKKRENKMEA
jgi:formylglycine-generating enzyme required for sulfatase activity